MVDPLDFDLTPKGEIRYCDGNQEIKLTLIDLVKEADDCYSAEEMNQLYEKLDEACCLARRLSKEM